MASHRKGHTNQSDSLMDIHSAVRSRSGSRAASRATSRLAESELAQQRVEDIQGAADFRVPQPLVTSRKDWASAVFSDAAPGPGHVNAEKLMLSLIEEAIDATAQLFRGTDGDESMELWTHVETKNRSRGSRLPHVEQLRVQGKQV